MIIMPKQRALDEIDYYPSRIADVPSIMERCDPVVHGTTMTGLLDKDRLNFYDRNGYLFFDSLFSASEIEILLSEVKNLKRQRENINPEYVIEELDSGEVRSFFHVHDYNAVFRAIAQDARIISIVTQILGGRVYIHQSRINLKPGFKGKEFYWHSDFETWHVEDGMPRMRALSCTINLTENNEHNGPLMVIPGSHKSFISCVGKTPENHYRKSLKKQEYGVPDEMIVAEMAQKNGIISLKGKAGSVVLFDCNILHGSNSNITPWPRSNIFFVYNSVDNTLHKPYCGLNPRPEHIATRNASEPL